MVVRMIDELQTDTENRNSSGRQHEVAEKLKKQKGRLDTGFAPA